MKRAWLWGLAVAIGCGGGAPDRGGVAESASTGGAMPMAMAPEEAPLDRDSYARVDASTFRSVETHPRSTFSADVDTASYSNVRRFLLQEERLPPADAVRIEEMVNYFRYAYPEPEGDSPFGFHTEVRRAPWNEDHLLVQLGLATRPLDMGQAPPRNLVFLLDVSGSMNAPDKLGLLKRGLALLTQELRPNDSVSIVVYAGASGLLLPPTSGEDRGAILDVLDQLRAGGSTNGGEGIELAYRVAEESFVEGGINRVILATDGDFNVGVSSEGALTRLIEEKRESGVFLTVLGFGRGNLQDDRMEALADRGNGNYAYIDSLAEARRVLVREAGSTLVTVASDVKIQVEFNPAQVSRYRLLGYENRVLRDEDFLDDTRDAGEIGAGHQVTAFYEVVPVGAPDADAQEGEVHPLRYGGEGQEAGAGAQQAAPMEREGGAAGEGATAEDATAEDAAAEDAAADELLYLRVRYKEPGESESRELSQPLAAPADEALDAEPSRAFRFGSAVVAFGLVLRDDPLTQPDLAASRQAAEAALGQDPHGDRRQLVEMMRAAETLHQ